jgi:hypothetical protein
MRIYGGIGFFAIHFKPFSEFRIFEVFVAIMFPPFTIANLIFLITESLGGRELKFRGIFVMCPRGALTLSLMMGAIIGLVKRCSFGE